MRLIIRLPALWLVMGVLATPATASYQTGYGLLRECEKADNSLCLGYVEGVIDLNVAARGKGVPLIGPCIPYGAAAGQMALLVKEYLRAHAKDLHYEASLLVTDALSAAFPCRRMAG
jgi:hypothetical protein